MLTSVLVVLLLLVTLAYAALPLLARKAVDPLPDDSDPVLVDLEEERDALLRAIRELDARADLAPDRRDALRARYEAKAGQVLRALEDRREALVARRTAAAGGATAAPIEPVRARGRRRPWGALGLLGVAVATAASLGTFVIPRVGQATVTASFDADIRAGTALRDLQRAAERDATVPNLMALADAYWGLQQAENAETTYRRVLAVAGADGTGLPPALAYKRLALLTVPIDLGGARDLLVEARRIDPTDPETLFAIGELSFALDDLDASAEAFRAYLATPDGADDADARARLALVEALGPAAAALADERSEANLLALADVYWTSGAQDPAVELYFEVLTDHDPFATVALARTGQLLFVRGRTDDAVAVLERAAVAAGGLRGLEPQATLFLGNAYAIQGDDAGAVRAWEAHVDAVGFEAAGRVTGLIEAARARLEGSAVAGTVAGTPPAGGAGRAGGSDVAPVDEDFGDADRGDADRGNVDPVTEEQVDGELGHADQLDGEPGAEDRLAPDPVALASAALEDPELLLEVGDALYAANCATCHGSVGQGGAGPRLSGNARAGNESNVRSIVRFGRGMMPGFGARLAEPEIDVLVRWVGQELAAPR